MEVLKSLLYDSVTPDNKNWEEKYKVIAPESLQETSFMSDSEDEGGIYSYIIHIQYSNNKILYKTIFSASDTIINEQPYRYLTADLMKSLRDDSLPFDVTRDDPSQIPKGKTNENIIIQSCLFLN